MVRSIRGRLQLWYALVLIAVISGFAGILYYRARTAIFREIDSQLESSAQYLEATLRGFPPHELEFNHPEPPFPGPPKKGKEGPPPPKGGKEGGPGPPPMRKSREQFEAELTVPSDSDSPSTKGDKSKPYFGVWRADGSLLKAVDLPDDAPRSERDRLTRTVTSILTQRGQFREFLLRGPRNTTVLVGRSTRREEAELRAFGWQLTGIGLSVLCVGLAGGWWISARIFRPIAAMAASASKISANDMTGRIDLESADAELADLARVLNATFDRLQEAFERQAQFTADASHELRTPLAIIRSHAQLALERPRPPEEYRQTIESCLRAAGRMTSIVEALLTLARIDANSSEFQKQRLSLNTLVTEAVNLFRPLAATREVTISVELSEIEVEGDPNALTQVIANLLSNAIQYNRPQGTIAVRLKLLGTQAELAVSDTGSGIPDEDQPSIFERFYRVDKARSRASGGTGLGLAISKKIVEAHGGAIGFESKIDEGTTFWVKLPCTVEA